MRKAIAALATVAIVVGGFAAALIVQTPSVATAQESDTSDTEMVPVGIGEILTDLVDEGVITSEQADQISATLQQRLGEFRMGRQGFHGGGRHLATAAEIIGVDVDTLAESLRNGQTLAEVAEANDVSAQALIDALVGEMNANLDQAVEDGRLTSEQADEIRANAPDRIESMVNGEFEGRRFEGRGFRGPHGFGFGLTPEDSTDATGTST